MSIELIHSSRTSTFTRPSPNSVSKHGSSEVDWRVESPRSPLRSWVSFWLGHLIAFEVAFFTSLGWPRLWVWMSHAVKFSLVGLYCVGALRVDLVLVYVPGESLVFWFLSFRFSLFHLSRFVYI